MLKHETNIALSQQCLVVRDACDLELSKEIPRLRAMLISTAHADDAIIVELATLIAEGWLWFGR